MTVVVVALGRSLHFLSFSAAADNSTDKPPNPSTASTCVLPGLGGVRKAAPSGVLSIAYLTDFR